MKPYVVAISGVKNSGKTTFIEGILPLLKKRGLRVAVIKHDGHSFEPDVPDTDSWRFRMAGADGIAIYCGTHYMVVREKEASAEELCGIFKDADLIICEGMKHSSYPKIEILRAANRSKPVCGRDTLLAIATDVEGDFAVPRIGLEDYDKAVEIILNQGGKF